MISLPVSAAVCPWHALALFQQHLTVCHRAWLTCWRPSCTAKARAWVTCSADHHAAPLANPTLQAGDVPGVQRILQEATVTAGFKHDEQSLKLLIDAYMEAGLSEQAQQCSQQLYQLRMAAKAAKRAASGAPTTSQPSAAHRPAHNPRSGAQRTLFAH
jgi:hypothetical protein